MSNFNTFLNILSSTYLSLSSTYLSLSTYLSYPLWLFQFIFHHVLSPLINLSLKYFIFPYLSYPLWLFQFILHIFIKQLISINLRLRLHCCRVDILLCVTFPRSLATTLSGQLSQRCNQVPFTKKYLYFKNSIYVWAKILKK